MTKKLLHISLIVFMVSAFWSCQEPETLYIYELDDVDVSKPASEKNNVKSQTEFIAIAYADLTGSNISSTELEALLAPYRAFGDQKLIEQMIIKSFLVNPAINIPSQADMLADVDAFVVDIYKRFYNREPDEFELWQIKNMINDNANMEPAVVYFAIMTSDEYRYY